MLRRCRLLLGTFVEVAADHADAIEASFETIARVHRLMSAHEPESDVSRINRFAHLGPVEVEPWTAFVLERALFWSKESEGAFDIVRAGKAAAECGYLPCHPGQPRPQALHWTWLEIQGDSVRMLKPGCIDLGGIAKGFAVDKAVDTLRSAGCRSGLVNAGGDLAGFGPSAWPVQVADPFTRRPRIEIQLSNAALATSAIHADEQSPHLPGRQVCLVSATVRTPRAIDADALAKVLLAGSPAAARCMAIAKAEGLVFSGDGEILPASRLAQAA